MGIQEVWDNFKKFTGDLTSLDVVTLSGSIQLAGNTSSADLGDLPGLIETAVKEGMVGQPGATVRVSVVAFTHMEYDMDSTHFVASGADATLLESHKEIVKAAQETRNGFIQLVKGIVTGS